MNHQNNSFSAEDFHLSFDLFWEKIILPTIHNAHDELDRDFANACDMKTVFGSDYQKYKDKIRDIYHEKREWLKVVYLPHEKHPLLDMHKLSAILCRSILACKPFCFDYQKAEQFVVNKFKNDEENHIDWFVSNIYVNYKVAFYISTGLIYLELLYSNCPKGRTPDDEALKYYLNLGGVLYYPKSSSHDNYEKSCIIALQKNDVLGRNFDYLTYAANMFQLEVYNRMLYDVQKSSQKK